MTFSSPVYPPQSGSTRIVGGNDAREGEAPYQCSMQQGRFHFCGCSIINNKWLVTASHCINGQRPSDLEILVGTNDLTKGGTRYKVSALYEHSRFNIPYFANDIGLIRISGSISFTTSIQPIEYSPKEVQPNSTLQLSKTDLFLFHSTHVISPFDIFQFVAGWGYLSADGIAPNALQIINLSAISYEQCQAIYGGDVEVDIGHICTLTKKGEGACNVSIELKVLETEGMF